MPPLRRVATLDEVVAQLEDAPAPACPSCGAILKPNVVMFGELLPAAAIDRAFELARSARLLLVVGSTLEVHPVAGLPLETIAAGGALAIVNRGPTALDDDGLSYGSRERPGRSSARASAESTLGRGAAERLLVEHALAVGADLPFDLERNAASLPDRQRRARVLVLVRLRCHLSPSVGLSSKSSTHERGIGQALLRTPYSP